MASWVIDEYVFECTEPRNNKCNDALYLIETIYRFHKVVLDVELELESKYRRFFEKNEILRRWFVKLTKNANHTYRCTSKLNASIEAELTRLGFHNDDWCFVGAALSSGKLIVTEDSDYGVPGIKKYFESLMLEILTIDQSNNQEATKRAI